MSKQKYQPWKKQRDMAGVFSLLVPVMSLVVAVAFPQTMFLAAGVAALSFTVGSRMMARASARQYGQQVEAVKGRGAADVLREAGYGVQEGLMTRVGDIDLLVSHGAWTCNVEIKAFYYWNKRVRDSAREHKARAQARRQQEVLNTTNAVIWLPNSRHTLWSSLMDWLLPERHPWVVRGRASALLRRIEALRLR